MEQVDRDTIQRNIVLLSSMGNLEGLFRELLQRRIIDPLFIERIKAAYKVPQEQAQEFFMSYTKRGPLAFQILIESLERVGHTAEANTLRSRNSPAPIQRTNSSEVSSTTGNGFRRSYENGTNGYAFPSSSSSNSPTSSTSVPSSPLMRPIVSSTSRVEPLSGSNSLSSSCSSLSTTDQVRNALSSCTMEDQPPLVIEVRHAVQYNNGVHGAYEMMSRPRGHALIVNNIEFLGDPGAKREGAEKDTIHLRQLLEQMGFVVTVEENVGKYDLIDSQNGIIKRFLDKFNETSVDACVVAVMSHGKDRYIRSADAEDVRNPNRNYWHLYDEIVKPFNNRFCPALKGKPKIFIIQACQGERRDRGVRRTQTDGKDLTVAEAQSLGSPEQVHPPPPENLPETEDMIVCYSTVPGFVSNRDTERGTWYICSLCKVFMEHAWETELLKLLQKVGLEMRKLTSEFGSKQMSSFHVLGFHFDLYFNPGLFIEQPL